MATKLAGQEQHYSKTDNTIDIIEEDWAKPKPPYTIYLKMVYHLSQEARGGRGALSKKLCPA